MKRREHPPINELDRLAEVDLGAQLADLKLAFYQQSLLLSALIDHLIEKGLIEPDKLAELVTKIDAELTSSTEE